MGQNSLKVRLIWGIDSKIVKSKRGQNTKIHDFHSNELVKSVVFLVKVSL